MHIVKRFHCDYCKKVLSKKGDMEYHESHCPGNPETRSCGTCSYFGTKTVGVGLGLYKYLPYCELGKFSETNKSERNPHGLRSHCEFHFTDPYRF